MYHNAVWAIPNTRISTTGNRTATSSVVIPESSRAAARRRDLHVGSGDVAMSAHRYLMVLLWLVTASVISFATTSATASRAVAMTAISSVVRPRSSSRSVDHADLART